jgi:DNA polymerase-3 subunit epsilon
MTDQWLHSLFGRAKEKPAAQTAPAPERPILAAPPVAVPPTIWREIAAPAQPVAGCTALVLALTTTTAEPDSACEIGLAWLAGRRIAATAALRIRPPDAYSDPGAATSNTSGFAEIWDRIGWHFARAVPVVAHGAVDQLTVLAASAARAGVTLPGFDYICTRDLAREAWPSLADHELATVAARIGADCSGPGPAVAAEVTARILASALDYGAATSPHAAARRFGREIGRFSGARAVTAPPQEAPAEATERPPAEADPPEATSESPPTVSLPVPELKEPPPPRPSPLNGRTIAFAGRLTRMTPSDATDLVQACGAIPAPSISKTLNYLVVGDAPGVALARAEALIFAGAEITLLDETEFLALIGEAR